MHIGSLLVKTLVGGASSKKAQESVGNAFYMELGLGNSVGKCSVGILVQGWSVP